MKVVINTCYGGFSVSLVAARFMAEAGSERAKKEVAEHEEVLRRFRLYRDGELTLSKNDFNKGMWDIDIKYDKEPEFHGYGYVEGMDGRYERNDPHLVAAVEKLGDEAGGSFADLKVVEIPDDVDWEIDEYDGNEHIAEKHRIWR